MNDYRLQFTDEEAWLAAADAAGWVTYEYTQQDPPVVSNKFINLPVDVIGTIYKPTGEIQQTDEGEVPVMAAVPGWHVNVRLMGPLPDVLRSYRVIPANPVRTFAGGWIEGV